MRECPERNELERFLNDQLDAPRSMGISKHLESCHICQSCCDEMTHVVATGSTDDLTRSSGAALDDLMRRIAKSPPTGNEKPLSTASIQFPGPADETAPLGRLTHYAIQERIAEGSQGVLFRAIDETLNRQVALKVLRPHPVSSEAAQARFLREARIGAALRHRNVVQVLQVCQDSGFPPYLVLEFVVGHSLRERMDDDGPLTATEAARIIREAALGLQAAHEAGMIHRDVKPSNLLVDSSGCVRVTDFGLAIEDTSAARMTQEGTIIGTPAYMSPEQIRQPLTIDARSDLYSLGVVLYEMLAGEVPFRGTVQMTLLQIAHDEPCPLRHFSEAIPRDLETICLRLLSKNPDARFQSAQQLTEELDRWQQGRPILSRPVSRTERTWRWCRRNPLASSLAGIIVVLVLGLVAVLSVFSWRLAESADQTQRYAAAAVEQRNAALETLQRLVFQLQSGFDNEEVGLDELQQQSLQIALDGLRHIRIAGDGEAEHDLPTAEALRRMGELLCYLDDEDQSREYLRQAEKALRKCLERSPAEVTILSSLVETLWTLYDVADEGSAAEEDLQLLTEATQLARTRRRLDASDSAIWMLSESLLNEAEAHFDFGGPEQAKFLISECLLTCEPLLGGNDALADDMCLIWFDAANLYCVLLAEEGLDAECLQFLTNTLHRAEALLLPDTEDIDLLVAQLSLQERWWSACVQQHSELQGRVQQQYDDLIARLAESGSTDGNDFFLISASLSAWILDRLKNEETASAIRLQQAGILIIERRLEVDPRDEFAKGELARAWCELAESEWQSAAPADHVRHSFLRSVSLYRELARDHDLDESDRMNFIETLLSAAEVSRTTPEADWTSLADEAEQELRNLKATIADLSDENWELNIRGQLQELRASRNKSDSLIPEE